ncbi:lipase maturation factor family protein [Microbacterium sp. ARD32]|uniref:lipase maturation factor family protein n=1 Tax=Microbacterium sp. ARD32 TaxID=2962577 RepID=UPI0028825FA5|nr:lipase maturation factor family protein [Microbacterium sp. ARD32]MDT0157681.1 lipase maturation factor family protein [Microbacterium sp. ARD32]
MDGFAAIDFGFAREVVQRGIAALYLIAFLSTLNQFRPLLGERGLLPAPELLSWASSSKARSRMLRPTLFARIRYTDRRLAALCWAGMVIAVLLVIGIPQFGPPWVPMIAFLLLWLGYMSVVSIGQTFYGFGWEMLLLEAGFLAAFLGSRDQPPPTVVIVLLWWLVFRLEFGAGMIKFRGGREWRDLTALTYHHETQPMPGPLSRQAHLLPRWFHKGEVLGNHFAQLVVPFFLFAPLLSLGAPVLRQTQGPTAWVAELVEALQLVGTVAAVIVILTQLWLIATGNFAWLNWATVVLAFSAVSWPDGRSLPWVAAPVEASQSIEPIDPYWIVITSAIGILYLVISWPALRNLFARRQLMNASFNRWQLANAYGAFGTVTKQRIEFVIEGTTDADPDAADWREYEFKGKPGEVRRIPRQFAPYHLRLDWLMWFLPLGRSLEDWFAMLLVRLLEADEPTLRMLRRDPFAGERPRWVRVVAYRYRFTTHAEKRASGDVWTRERQGLVVRPLGG